MAGEWTAQLHIINGEASEDAPEIAYAERADHRGCAARLYLLAEPGRPDSERFIADLVNRIGEDFLGGEGSVTGIAQRALRNRHEELLDWNRTSLPRDQAAFGVSCLIVRDHETFLAQMGPSLAFHRHEGRLFRRRPATVRAAEPLGGAQLNAPEFSQVPLAADDWVLLISSNAAEALTEEALGAVRGLAADDVLPALYPLLRPLPRVSALLIAPQAAPDVAATAVSHDRGPAPALTVLDPVESEATLDSAAEPVASDQPIPPEAPTLSAEPTAGPERYDADAESWDADAAQNGEPTSASPEPVWPAPVRNEHAPASTSNSEAWNADDLGDDDQREDAAAGPQGTPRGPALRGLGGRIGRGLARAGEALRPRRPGRGPENAAWREAEQEARAAEAAEPHPAAEPVENVAAEQPVAPEAAENVVAEHTPETKDPATADHAAPPEGVGTDGPGNHGSDAPQAKPPSPRQGTLEFFSQPAVAHWPANPFAPPAPPVLQTASDLDGATLGRLLFGLRGTMPQFRRRAPRASGGQAGEARVRGGSQIAAGIGALLLVFSLIAGVILIPDLLRNSDSDRFEQLLTEGRRSLTAATLTTDADAGRAALLSAQAALAEALDLRPLDPTAQTLRQEIDSALRQVNAIIRPADLAVVFNFATGVAPPLALAAVETGADSVFVLDESGGRIFAMPLGGGDPQVIFQRGAFYPVISAFSGPSAGNPLAMHWSRNTGIAALTILDDNGWLYRYTEAGGVDALPLPNAEVLAAVRSVAVGEDGIYLLDSGGGMIWRIPVRADGTLSPALPAIARSDLGQAIALAVNGDSLFTGGADGRIRRFTGGEEQGYPLVDLDRPLLISASLIAANRSGLVFAVDRGNDRLLVLTSGGELVAQLRDPLLAGLRGVALDETQERIYFVTADTFLTAPLPAFPARPAGAATGP